MHRIFGSSDVGKRTSDGAVRDGACPSCQNFAIPIQSGVDLLTAPQRVETCRDGAPGPSVFSNFWVQQAYGEGGSLIFLVQLSEFLLMQMQFSH
jgi:hypothetical protein